MEEHQVLTRLVKLPIESLVLINLTKALSGYNKEEPLRSFGLLTR